MAAHDDSDHVPLSTHSGGNPLRNNDYDPLLPVQYYERVCGGHTLSGEVKLFFAILEDALRCYVRARNCRSGLKRVEFVEVRKWFFTRGSVHVFGFESVCANLDIEPDWLRTRLDTLSPADLPLKQFRTRRRRLARLPAPATKANVGLSSGAWRSATVSSAG